MKKNRRWLPQWPTCHCLCQRPRPGYLRLAGSEARCGPWGRPGSTYCSQAAGTCLSPGQTNKHTHTHSSNVITKKCILISWSTRHYRIVGRRSRAFLFYFFIKCICLCVQEGVCMCVSLNESSNLKKRGREMKGYWKKDEALSLSLSLHIKHDHYTEKERLHDIAPLSSLHSPLLHPSPDTHFTELWNMFYSTLILKFIFLTFYKSLYFHY